MNEIMMDKDLLLARINALRAPLSELAKNSKKVEECEEKIEKAEKRMVRRKNKSGEHFVFFGKSVMKKAYYEGVLHFCCVKNVSVGQHANYSNRKGAGTLSCAFQADTAAMPSGLNALSGWHG